MRKFVVGTFSTSSPSKVTFTDRLITYQLMHPVHHSVTMKMFYEDFANCSLLERAKGGVVGVLRFHVARQLEYFGREYNPADESHMISLSWDSPEEFDRFKRKAWTKMSSVVAITRCLERL